MESAFAQFDALTKDPEAELEFYKKTDFLIPAFHTPAIAEEYWHDRKNDEDENNGYSACIEADALVLFLDPTSESLAYLMTHQAIHVVRDVPVVLVEFKNSAAGGASAKRFVE